MKYHTLRSLLKRLPYGEAALSSDGIRRASTRQQVVKNESHP
jgi:hypothetical protein